MWGLQVGSCRRLINGDKATNLPVSVPVGQFFKKFLSPNNELSDDNSSVTENQTSRLL